VKKRPEVKFVLGRFFWCPQFFCGGRMLERLESPERLAPPEHPAIVPHSFKLAIKLATSENDALVFHVLTSSPSKCSQFHFTPIKTLKEWKTKD